MKDERKADLHVHSYYSSDGQYSPAELITFARAEGLAAVALTDHDEVGGLPEFAAAGEAGAVEAIPGVELIDGGAPSIRDALDALTRARLRQAAGRLARLRELGIVVDDAKLDAEARGQPPVGPIIGSVVLNDPANDAHPLLEPFRRPPKSAMPYFHFDRDILSHGKPAYFPVDRMSPAKAVVVIAAAGGVAVFAHPGDKFHLPADESVFRELAAAGLAGLEAYSSYHEPAQEDEFAAFARRLGLVVTAGSDFHGPKVKPNVVMSKMRYNPYIMVEELKARRGAPAK